MVKQEAAKKLIESIIRENLFLKSNDWKSEIKKACIKELDLQLEKVEVITSIKNPRNSQ